MKNKIKKTLALFTLVYFLLNTNSIKSQVTCGHDWVVENATSCVARVTVEFYCNGALCKTAAANNIQPGTSQVYTWLGCPCSGSCDVKVTLLQLDQCLLGISVMDAGPQVVSWGSCFPGCLPQGGTNTNMTHQGAAHVTEIGQ